MPLFHMRSDTSLICVNVAFARTFGFPSPADAVYRVNNGRGVFVSQRKHAEFRREIRKNQGVIRFDAELQRDDGSAFWGEFIVDGTPRIGVEPYYQGNVYNLTPMDTEENVMKCVMGAIVSMAQNLLGRRDSYTALHQQRVATLCCLIADDMKLHSYMADALHLSALIHDIGKIAVPIEFLTKPGALTQLERKVLSGHVRAGYDMLKNVSFPWPIAEIIYQHHERLDGSGYPRRIKGMEIVMEARIIAVADTVEAIMYDRPYRPGKGVGHAMEIISELSGKELDPLVVESCHRVVKELGRVLPHRRAIIA